MGDKEEIREAILEALYSNWKREPLNGAGTASIQGKVRRKLGDCISSEVIESVLDELVDEHLINRHSSGKFSLRASGLEQYNESHRTLLDDGQYITILEYLIGEENHHPGKYVDISNIRDETDLSGDEVKRNTWYLFEKGLVEKADESVTEWYVYRSRVRIEPSGRRFYERQTAPVSSETGEFGGRSQYDIFISHASEDKNTIVRPLAQELENLGVKVWYDEFELIIGDSLRKSIDEGLSQSRYGVVVLSESFFKKQWTEYELNGLTAKDIGDKNVILPVWYNIGRDTIESHSPTLADKKAERINEENIPEVAGKLSRVAKRD